MHFFQKNFKWIMLVSGILTCSMFLGLFSPEASLHSNFGETVTKPVEEIIVRGWCALIGLIGIMLIYGSFVPAVRNFSLVIAGTSKIVFIILVLSFGKQFLAFGAGTAVIADAIMVVLYAVYLYLSWFKVPSTRK